MVGLYQALSTKLLADFPGEVRGDAVAFVVVSKGYVGLGVKWERTGNIYNMIYRDDFYRYDPSTNSWTKLTGTAAFPGEARDDGMML
ncbi:MAG: hypothetical protein MI674_06710 [Cytophagales bacterium]|nr:hypothetical protein [Cytophagales bacterium]